MNPGASAITLIDVVVIAVSILLVVIVGLWASRKQGQTAQDYFIASGKLPWWMIGTAFVSTSVSSEQIVGTIGQAYESGMILANSEWWSLPPYIILIAVFIPIYLKNKISTVPELLSRRFSPLCGQFYAWVMLVAYVLVFLAPVLYGGSLTFAELTGINYWYVLIVMSVLVMLYTVKGGLFSVMWTDALQCLMLVGGGLILYFVALDNIPGGWTAMVEANPERFHLYGPPSDPINPFAALVIGTFGLFLFYQGANQVMVQRVFGARSTWDGIMGIIFAGLINLVRPLVTCFLGFIVYHWVHVLHNATPEEIGKIDNVFPFALKTFASDWGLRGVVLAGFLAAVMSTVSALANSTSTIFSLEIYKKLINTEASDKQLVRVGRYATFIAILIGMFWTHVVSGVGLFKYFQTYISYVATPFAATLIMGIFWKRANHQAALFGLIGGSIIMGLVATFGAPAIETLLIDASRVPETFKLNWLYTAGIAQVIIMLGMVFVALATPPPPEEKWRPFLWTPGLLAEVTAGDRPWYASLRLWFAVFAGLWIYIYWLLW